MKDTLYMAWRYLAHHKVKTAILVCSIALIVYLRITRDFGATWVSLANYISMIFAALIGVLVFEDRISAVTAFAAIGIVLAVTIHQWPDRSRSA